MADSKNCCQPMKEEGWSCCPAGSHQFLKANPTANKGFPSVLGATTGGDPGVATVGVEAYVVGSVSNGTAVLLIPDVWGWDSGRIREVADRLAENLKTYCVIPKILSPPLEGGTSGDGLPPDFDLEKRGKDLGPFIGRFGRWEQKDDKDKDAIGPKIRGVFEHFADEGVEKVAGVGFCFGGWVLLEAANVIEEQLATDLVCCAVPHPSCHAVLGNKGAVKKAGSAQCPMLMLPAGNDPDIYDPEKGTFMAALKEKQPASHSITFPDMLHGWSIRGDLTDPKIDRDVKIVIDEVEKYIGKFLTASKL